MIPLSFSEKIFEKTWILVHKMNKKFLVNALRTLGHFVCKLSSAKLTHVFKALKSAEFILSSKKTAIDLLFEDLLVLLQHSFPKYAWNVAYIFDAILNSNSELKEEQSVRGQLRKLILSNSRIMIELLLSTPNLKLKMSLARLMKEGSLLDHFNLD